MTIVNVIEDSNNPQKYLIVSTQGATSESIISTNVVVSSNNKIELIEISKIQGDKGDKGEVGQQGPPGQNGVIFDLLPIISGGTNNTSFNNNKVIYYDGTKLTSSNIDVNNIQTDIISSIYTGSGLSKEQNGQSVTVNAALGDGLTLDAFNRITIDDTVITQYNFDLSTINMDGKLGIPYGGTNNTFFSNDKFVYYDGEKLASFPLSTGSIVVSGQTVNIVAGSGLIGGGQLSIPNGSIVIGIQNSADILVTNDTIELTSIVNSGIYSKVTVDSKGRVTHGSQITLNDLVSYLGFTPWYSGNDGSGSNLDADMLDGQHGSYYADASNLTGTISNSVLPETIGAGSAPKVTFNSKGIIIDSGILSYLDITEGLGYIPFDKAGGQLLGDVELLGSLISNSGSFLSNSIGIGSYDASLDARGITFRYGDYPQKDAILGYYPESNTFRISSIGQSGKLITEEKADTKYVGITGYQQISGFKDFLESITTYGRVIIRSKYNSLPPLDIGTNNQLVLYLNADYLDNQHGHYYRNAANLTGTLNEYVIIPHLEDRSTVEYSDDGALEYIPKFHRPSPDHPIVLKDSLIYETGSVLYMDYASLSVGLNNINQNAFYTTLIGSNNSGTATSQNSLAVGENNIVSGINSIALNKNNIAMTDNSIAMGTNAETWINNQIALGGFSHNNVGTNGKVSRDAHGQLSYIPLKYHGEANGWVNILNFNLPDNKTIEYSAELLFTKQKETGVASFFIGTGIVKNYGYRDPARNYESFKKTIPVVNHKISELYNNSQERTYGLNIIGISEIDQEINQSTLKITAPPLQYLPLDIEAYDSPIVIKPISDHQTRLKVTRGNVLAGGYRPQYVVKLSPFDQYPYHAGAKINHGRNVNNLTECLYYRVSGSPTGYIKFHNHGISDKCPLFFDNYIGSANLGISGLLRRDSNFNLRILDNTNNITTKRCSEPPISGYIFRQYINKNIQGSLSGSATFNIYQTSGIADNNHSPYILGGYNNSLASVYHKSLSFNFYIDNLDSSSRDWSTLDDHKLSLIINKVDSASWSDYSLNILGYINPILGTIEFNLSQNQPFSGPGIPTGSNPNYPFETYYYYPNYYIDELSFVSNYQPYSYTKNINDSFKVIDANTISFSETQLGFVSGQDLILSSYPNKIKDLINFEHQLYNTFLNLKNNDTLYIDNTLTKITGAYTDSNLVDHYILDHEFSTTGIYSIYLANASSGIGFVNSRSFTTISGSYSFDKNINNTYTKTTSSSYTLPLISVPCPNPLNLNPPPVGCTVPTGSDFSFILNGPYYDSTDYVSDIITSFISPFKIACTSIQITNDGSNNFNIPRAIIPKSSIIIDSGSIANYQLLDPSGMDFRVNNIRVFDSYIPIFYSGYTGVLSNQYDSYLLSSGNIFNLHTAIDLDNGDYLSYRFFTESASNNDPSIDNNLRSDPLFPSMGSEPTKTIRSSHWLLSSSQINGSVYAKDNQTFTYKMYPTGIQLTNECISNFISNTHSTGSYTIATGAVVVIPDNQQAWTNAGLGSPVATCSIKVIENYQLSDYGNLLNLNNRNIGASLSGRVCETIIYDTIDLQITSSPVNTGIFSSTITVKKPYQTLNFSISSYDELFRFMNNSYASTNMYNNFDISFNLNNLTSGIFHFDTLTNKTISNYPYSKIYNIGHGSTTTFSVAVESGYLPTSVTGTGNAIFAHTKVYDMQPKSLISTRGNKTQGIFQFLNNDILKSGIYDIESLGNANTSDVQSIYLYDFAKNFSSTGTTATGILYHNHTAYNITDSKFSIWGRNFDGDTIIKPFRDLTAIIQDTAFSCATGYLCVKLSGVPNFVKQNDIFWIDIEPYIYPQSSVNITCTGTGIWQTNMLYVPDAINNGVVLGMNVINGKINNPYGMSYITQINGPYLTIADTITTDSITTSDILTFNRETTAQQTVTNTLRGLLQNHLMGYYPIYRDSIEPNVVSVLIPIPPFYYRTDHPYYNEWNTRQNTRGINVWRSSGNLGSLIMITGTENIQTDKDPNYGYRFLDVLPNISISPAPTGYITSGTPNIIATGILTNNRQSHYGFNNDLKKYLSDMTISGIYKPCQTSGIISASAQLSDASNWTVSETKTVSSPLIMRDIDTFRIIGIDHIATNRQNISSLTSSGNNYVSYGFRQDIPVKFRIGINGGTAIPNKSPDILVSGIDSSYSISGYYIAGIPGSGSGLLSYKHEIGPFSHTWFKEISISGLYGIDKFGIEIRDPLGKDILSTQIININQQPPTPYIDNDTIVYYNTSLVSPWVMAFDLYNVSSGSHIGISGSSLSDTSIISSGVVYTPELQKWQGYIVGHATSSNFEYPVSFAITGDFFGGVAYGNNDITFTGVNIPLSNKKFTNNLSIIKFENTGINPIVGYFNYQKPQPYTSPSPTLSATNNPSGTTVAFAKIPTDYEQITSRELYSFTINNIGPTGYEILISALEAGITTNITSKILSYDRISISNINVIDPLKFIGETWQLSFDVNGGGGSEYSPDIQLINTPSIYSIGKTFNPVTSTWRIQATGDADFLGRYNQITGIYNIGIYARDLTGHASNTAIQTYGFPVDIQNIKKYYGIKEKDYFVNLDLTNPVEYYDSSYILPNINTFMPSTQTKIYDKYNYLLNLNEIRYSGDKLTDKWNTRLGVSNLNQEFNYTSETKSSITVDVRGLDTDIINVIGLLKLKELDVVSTDYPPIQIIGLQPEENKIKELNQGDPWEVSFGVIGGLSNPNFPPSILLSGLPSVCSGYFPDIDPAGPTCLKTRTYSNELQKWTFAFTGVSNCVTGQYDVAIKAFDITGEDSADTSFVFVPLLNPGPSIQPFLETALYPNCQYSSGLIKYTSSFRGLPCPYATGISGINVIGNLPPGLELVEISGLVQPSATGTAVLAVRGTPTTFPTNNIYDSFIIEVVDKVGKKAKTVITYNTAGIAPITRNPKAAAVYFPNSGYYTSYIMENGVKKDRVYDAAQYLYEPYPSTGLFVCRSVLPTNNCPPKTTGTYQKLTSSGVNVFFGGTAVGQNNAFVFFNNNITDSYNGIYSIINISSQNYSYDPETNLFVPQYSGLLINLANTGALTGISPTSGTFEYVPFSVVQSSPMGSIMLSAYPTPVVSCKTCLLGNGYIDETNKLAGTMKASAIATITGNYYPYETYSSANPYLPGGPPNINLLNGLGISNINNITSVSEVCFSNCYESGSIYLSGIIIPMPTLDITDPQSVTYNGQPVALATRCSYGSGAYRGSAINYRSLNIQYYIKDLINNKYYDVDTNNFSSSPAIKGISTSPTPTNVNSISFSAPNIATGTILQLYMYRNADPFPTFDIHSYDYLEHSSYWIHKAINENDPITTNAYPGMIPIRFGSGLFISTGNPFNFNGQIIGGNATGTLAPTVTGTLTLGNTLIEVTGIDNNPHSIGVSLGSKIGDGLWNISITGNIIGLTGSYLLDYDLVVNTTENPSIPYGKNKTTSLPITLLKPIELYIPTTLTQSSTELYVNYGNKWNLTFNIIGGDRPPRYWTDINSWVETHYPTIEIDDTICSYEKISMSYNQNTNEWTVVLRSKNIITTSTTMNLSIKDVTGYISQELDIIVI